MLDEASMKHTVSRSLVFKWHKRFREGREDVTDDSGRGRKPSISTTLIETVSDVVQNDRRSTIRDICDETGGSYGAVQRILTETLNMHKRSARWVPRLLSQENKDNRVAASLSYERHTTLHDVVRYFDVPRDHEV